MSDGGVSTVIEPPVCPVQGDSSAWFEYYRQYEGYRGLCSATLYAGFTRTPAGNSSGVGVVSSENLRGCGRVFGEVQVEVGEKDNLSFVGSSCKGSLSREVVNEDGRDSNVCVGSGGISGCESTPGCDSVGKVNSCSFEFEHRKDVLVKDNDKKEEKPEKEKGPNWLRNIKNRAEQKARKAKRKSMGVDWRKRDGGDIVKQDDAPGAFWNSTSKEVRQQLIDSKAKMHIAENERREREARDKIAYYDSPESAMHKAVAMIEYAQKQAKKDKDSKVYGWAHTVASASAESLARSTPDSVPSFDELSAKLEASSQSSFELEIKAKQDELDIMEVELKAAKADARIARNMAAANLKHSEGQVAKEKHEAVVKRMRELELQKRKFEETESKMLFRVQKQERQRLHEEFGILT